MRKELSEQRRWLLLPIETKVREFHTKVLLAAAAAERGFDVLMGEQNAILAQLQHLPVGIFVDKSIAATKTSHFRLLCEYGHQVCAWCEEGLVYRDRDTYLHQRISNSAMDHVEKFFAWGTNQAEDILHKIPEAEGRVLPVGNPRFDLLRPEFRSIFAGGAEEHGKQHGRYLLINTNFSRSNHFLGRDHWIKAQRLRGGIKNADDERKVRHWIDFISKIFQGFAEALPELSLAFPDHKIILRPHPSENHAVWRDITARLNNVHVLHQGNVIPWIQGAECVIHNSCTTAVEAHVLGTPVAAYRPETDNIVDSRLPNALSQNAYNCEELIETVRGLTTGRINPSDDVADQAGRYFAASTGALAVDRIADELAVLDPRTGVFKKDPISRFARLSTRAATMIRPHVRRLVRGNRVAAYAEQKFPGMKVGEVRAVLEQLHTASGRFGNIRIEALPLHHCFRFSLRQ